MKNVIEDLIENNILIAKFMGGELSDRFIAKVKIIKINHENYYSYGCLPEDLKYNTSFDWLMPVVEKIQSINITPPPNYTGYRIEIVVQGYVKISGFPMPPITKNVSIEGGLLNAIYASVIEFIKWYNIQNTTPTNS